MFSIILGKFVFISRIAFFAMNYNCCVIDIQDIYIYIIFELFTVIKFRDNYLNDIENLEKTVANMDEKYTGCRSDLHTTQENIAHLSEVKGTCLETLKHVSETMELLSSAFSSKHSLSQNISFELAESRKAARIMKKDLSTREESLSQLKLENKELKNSNYEIELKSHSRKWRQDCP